MQAAVSFRDAGLFSVFQLALTALRQLAAPGQQADPKLQEQVWPRPMCGTFGNLSCPLFAKIVYTRKGQRIVLNSRLTMQSDRCHLQWTVCHNQTGKSDTIWCVSKQAVGLALAALSFDFVGTCLDESSEDLGTIQVPALLEASCIERSVQCRCGDACRHPSWPSGPASVTYAFVMTCGATPTTCLVSFAYTCRNACYTS